MRLSGKVAIVTGAASGIGAATARLFAAEGAWVAVVDRDIDGARAIADGFDGLAIACDVGDDAEVAAMVAETLDRFGGIDVLVANAGFGIQGSVTETEPDAWDELMRVNLKGVYLCARHAIPPMAAGGGGVIVNTSSNTALVGIRDRAAYVASKGGVAALTRAMAIDHAHQNIRVNAVLPGPTMTSYFNRMVQSAPDPEGFKAALAARSPLNRMAEPEEIARAILFLACEDSSFATGSLLTVDGGHSAW